jgi:Fic family protein
MWIITVLYLYLIRIPMFQPVYSITSAMTRALMAIEADRQAVAGLPMDVEMLSGLRESARLAATHYSTQIEGNRLTQAQVTEVVRGARFPGRERDEREVRDYYRALEAVEALASKTQPLTEAAIRRIHSLVVGGKARATPYRAEQNVIKNSGTGGIVYLPPVAKDVSPLMASLVSWVNASLEQADLPVPLVAALAHYQFATIHPYYDGNGRTARLLTTLILHQAGYGLRGLYSLEDYYAKNLPRYYETLSLGPSHNYYLGRAEADLTPFLVFFCEGMADAFAKVRAHAAKAVERGAQDMSGFLGRLDRRQRILLELFQKRGAVTAAEMAQHLGMSHGSLLPLCRKWRVSGFIEAADSSRKNRCYRLRSP